MTHQDLKNINQSIVIKHRTNYSIATVNCSHLDREWFFIMFHASPTAVFVEGAAIDF